MPSLDDLRDVFTDLERHAPAPQALSLPPSPAGRAPRTVRRTVLAATFASAAVVVVAAGAVLVGRFDDSGRTAATTPAAGRPAGQSTSETGPETSASTPAGGVGGAAAAGRGAAVVRGDRGGDGGAVLRGCGGGGSGSQADVRGRCAWRAAGAASAAAAAAAVPGHGGIARERKEQRVVVGHPKKAGWRYPGAHGHAIGDHGDNAGFAQHPTGVGRGFAGTDTGAGGLERLLSGGVEGRFAVKAPKSGPGLGQGRVVGSPGEGIGLRFHAVNRKSVELAVLGHRRGREHGVCVIVEGRGFRNHPGDLRVDVTRGVGVRGPALR